MHDISPPILSTWSGPPAPQCCLANRSPARKYSERLQAALESALEDRLLGLGSTIYQIAWKPHVTPLGRQISRQRASARRTSGNEPSSGLLAWPTPTTRDWKDGGNPDVNVELNGLLGRVVWLAGWPTAQASDGSGGGQAKRALNPARSNDLLDFVMLAGWPTPMAGTPAQNGNNAAGNNDSSRKTMELVNWARPDLGSPTPTGSVAAGTMTAGTVIGDSAIATPEAHQTDGIGTFTMAGWATPVSQQANGTPENFLRRKRESMERGSQPMGICLSDLNMQAQAWAADSPARFTASGQMLTGSSAGMESGGQLSPEHSRWLMGYPAAWGSCGATAMQSIRGRRKSSSKPSTPAFDIFG